MKYSSKWAITLSVTAAAVLAACGGGGGGLDVKDTSTKAITGPTTVAINAATGVAAAASIDDKKVTFAAGVAALGTKGSSTDVTFDTSPAVPKFSIVATGGSTPGMAAGDLSFGSCLFKITSSTFPSNHPLALGNTVRVESCNVVASTSGVTAGSAPTNVPTSLTLAGGSFTAAGSTATVTFSAVTEVARSEPVPVVVVINANNTLSVGGVTQTVVITIVPVTGPNSTI